MEDFRSVYGVLGDDRAAEKCCRKVLRLKPDYPEAHLNLGNVLKARSRYQEVIASYHEAIRCRSDYHSA